MGKGNRFNRNGGFNQQQSGDSNMGEGEEGNAGGETQTIGSDDVGSMNDLLTVAGADAAAEEVEHTKGPDIEVAQPVVLQEQQPQQPKVTTSDVVINAAKSENTGNDTYNKSVIAFLDKYLVDMGPGVPVNSKTGGNIQYNFYNTINQIFNQVDYNVFKLSFITLLAYFKKHDAGSFGDRFVFRFAEEWPGSKDKLINFHATLNLIKIIANDKERPVNKHVDLERTFNSGFSETAKENIMKFIGK